MHSNDKGTAADPSVLFAEYFSEKGLDVFLERWESINDPTNLSLSIESPVKIESKQSLLITHEGGRATGSVSFTGDSPQGFSRFLHAGMYASIPIAGPYTTSAPILEGAEISNLTDTACEGMGMEHFGERHLFRMLPALGSLREKWICVEMMIKLNDPPERKNGEQAFWIDGKLISHEGQIISHIGPEFP